MSKSSVSITPFAEIKIFLPDYFCDDDERVTISNGTQLVSKEQRQLFPDYADDAIIPHEPWSKLSDEQKKTYFTQEKITTQNCSRVVAAVKIEKDVIGLLEDRNLAYPKVLQLYKKIYQENSGNDAFREFTIRIINKYALKKDRLQVLGLYMSEEIDCFTSTVDGQSNKRMGLHVDNWDGAPLSKKDVSRNRICINLGADDRHFLFCDISVAKMAYYIQQKEPNILYSDEVQNDHHFISRAFMAMFPDYPITKLKICPGEAYIAATDNFIHDGSTENKIYPDMVFTILGDFSSSTE